MGVKNVIQRASYSLALITISQLAIANSDSGTLTPGLGGRLCNHVAFTLTGYLSGNFGTYSPTGLSGGKTVFAIMDFTPSLCSSNESWLEVSGFSSDPGKNWLTSITCNGVQNLASASGYSFTSGIARWAWGQKFGLSRGAQVSCTIVHS
jgi:hypothetical protein